MAITRITTTTSGTGVGSSWLILATLCNSWRNGDHRHKAHSGDVWCIICILGGLVTSRAIQLLHPTARQINVNTVTGAAWSSSSCLVLYSFSHIGEHIETQRPDMNDIRDTGPPDQDMGYGPPETGLGDLSSMSWYPDDYDSPLAPQPPTWILFPPHGFSSTQAVGSSSLRGAKIRCRFGHMSFVANGSSQ